jgi:pre-rRNA-processing protein IPI1
MMSLRIMQQRSGGGKSEVPLEFQKQWMQCLPHLLWELKHTHATVSQAVLQMLLQIGRSAPNGSVLAGEFSALQQQLIPFFCTFFTSTKNGVKCIYGPFSKLPRNCQELAIDMFFFFTNFSRVFLKAVAHCCLSAEISVEVTIRAVEVLHSVFIRGSLGLPEHLSFLLTLLSGHISAQGLSSLAASSTKLCWRSHNMLSTA